MSYVSPWEKVGTATPDHKPAAIVRRYRNSFLIVGVMAAVLLAAVIGVGELSVRFAWLYEKLAAFVASKPFLPQWLPTLVRYIVPCSLILIIIQAVPAGLTWVEMKVAAHIQVRLGPMEVGLWHGWAQTIADGIKLLLKEDIVPRGADKIVHFLAPIVVVAPAYVCYAPLPFGRDLAAMDLDIGLLFILGISGLSVIGLLMAGWGSNNKYSLLGGLRAAAQVVSYEIPRLISVLPVVMWAGSMSLMTIATAQEGLWGGFLPKWFIFYPVIGQVTFLIYLICSIAETNRVPFDLAEAESELVSGFMTEYSGMKFALFMLAEYAYMFLACGLGVVLFLGGGAAPWPALNVIPSFAWFLLKTLFLVFVFIWVRWSFPRMRVDRLMSFCWKFLLPWSLGAVVASGFAFLR